MVKNIFKELCSIIRARKYGGSAGIRFSPPGHYYSPIPSSCDFPEVNADKVENQELLGIDLRESRQIELWIQISEIVERNSKILLGGSNCRYQKDNDFFKRGDADVSAALFEFWKPNKIIEVGSGFSSALMLDVRDRCNLSTDITFIEPDPVRLDRLIRQADRDSVRIIKKMVQDVPVPEFQRLQAGDWLFIDSSHVLKRRSDLHHLCFNVLPLLSEGVIVHFHDIFWPFDYPRFWYEEGRAWNEVFFLRALLMFQNRFQIEFWNSWFSGKHAQKYFKSIPNIETGSSSIWLKCT